jgi:hypothetical protein
MRTERIQKNLNIILAKISSVKSTIKLKDIGLDLDTIFSQLSVIEKDIVKQGHSIIDKSKKPKKARNAKKILEDILEKKKLTPELLEEIKNSFKK